MQRTLLLCRERWSIRAQAYLNIGEQLTKGEGIGSTPNTTKCIIHYLRAACLLQIGTNSKPGYCAADVCTIRFCKHINFAILAVISSAAETT